MDTHKAAMADAILAKYYPITYFGIGCEKILQNIILIVKHRNHVLKINRFTNKINIIIGNQTK